MRAPIPPLGHANLRMVKSNRFEIDVHVALGVLRWDDRGSGGAVLFMKTV